MRCLRRKGFRSGCQAGKVETGKGTMVRHCQPCQRVTRSLAGERLQCPGGATYESRQVWPTMAPKQAASTRNKLPPARKDLSSVTVTVTFLRLSLLNQPSFLSSQLHPASCISILHLHQQQTSKARSLFCVELLTIYSSLGRILDLIAHHEERSSHCRRASGLCPGRHPQDEAQQGPSCRHTGTTGSHDAIIAHTVQALTRFTGYQLR